MAGPHHGNRESRKQGEVKRMKGPALFLLASATLSGCISDSLEDGAVALQYGKLFEAGRRAESKGNIKIAEDTYGWLIGRDNRYGEYGLAMLKLRREPGSRESVKLLLACAKRSDNDSAMDCAFSAAAMAKLSDIAVSEHGRPDVAASLRCMMSEIVTTLVTTWAEKMKADADSATIYGDIVSAVKSSRRSRERAKTFTWDEIEKAFLNEGSDNGALGEDNR